MLPDGDVDRQADALVAGLPTGVTALHGYFAHRPGGGRGGRRRPAWACRTGSPPTPSTSARCTRASSPARAARARGVVTCNHDTARGAGEPRGAGVPRAPRRGRRRASRPEPEVTPPGRCGRSPSDGWSRRRGSTSPSRRSPSSAARSRCASSAPGRTRRACAQSWQRWAGATSSTSPARRTHDELPQEYADADVVVVPSVIDCRGDRDGLPNVVLEAMASGRAVVASDVAAVSDAVEHDVTGLLFPPGDASALAERCASCDRDPARLRAPRRRRSRSAPWRAYDLAACTEVWCSELSAIYG